MSKRFLTATTVLACALASNIAADEKPFRNNSEDANRPERIIDEALSYQQERTREQSDLLAQCQGCKCPDEMIERHREERRKQREAEEAAGSTLSVRRDREENSIAINDEREIRRDDLLAYEETAEETRRNDLLAYEETAEETRRNDLLAYEETAEETRRNDLLA